MSFKLRRQCYCEKKFKLHVDLTKLFKGIINHILNNNTIQSYEVVIS